MTASQTLVLVAAVAFGSTAWVAGECRSRPSSPRPVEPAASAATASPRVADLESRAEPASDPAARVDPPGSFVAIRVPRAAAGIECPDGTFLPPLNGVTADDPIPRLRRDAFMAPIGEVVGKFTDDTGVAWWVTEDGSAFTTRWSFIESAGGERRRVVRLDQADRLGAEFAVGARQARVTLPATATRTSPP